MGGGCFSIFRRADDVTRTMSKGGGACEIPPSGNPVSAPVICVKFWYYILHYTCMHPYIGHNDYI